MKSALVVLSLCAIAALLVEIIRLHSTEFTKWAVFYLLAQFLFMFVCWKAALLFGWSSHAYMRAFYCTMAVLSVTAAALSFRFLGNVPQAQARFALVEVTGAFVAVLCGTFAMGMSQANMLSRFAVAHILCAGILVFCGALSLAALAFPSDAVGDMLKMFLGTYWLAQGAYGLVVEPWLFLRGRSVAVAKMSFIPILISAVVFSSLAVVLRTYQREGSRQSLAADSIKEAR